MTARPRRSRLARLVYLYTAVCVVGAVAVFLAVATWHFSSKRRPPPPDHRPPAGPRHDRPPPPPPPSPNPPPDLLFIVGGILLGLVSVGSFVFARRITIPLRRLEDAAQAFGAGDHDARANIGTDDEIGAAGAAFDDMAEQTTALIRAQEELLANVAHELRTPLARMRVAIDMARERGEVASGSTLDHVDLDVVELQALVGDVLAALRVAMTSGLRDVERIDLAAVVTDVGAQVAARHPDRELRIEADEPQWCRGVTSLIERVIRNLLDNALKYSREPVVLRVGESEDAAFVEVADRGDGIPAGDLAELFTPFFRGDRSRDRQSGGVGLGLSLVKRIAEAHGGTATLASEVGQGTTARVTFPKG